jgi:hypothetical protein
MKTTRKNTPFRKKSPFLFQLIETFLEGLFFLFIFLLIGPFINIAWIMVELFFFTIGIACLMVYAGLGFWASLTLILLGCYVLCLLMVVAIHAEGYLKKDGASSASPKEQKNQL